MKQLKLAVSVLVLISCVVTLVLYSWNRSTLLKHKRGRIKPKLISRPMVHVPLDEVYPDMSKSSINDSLELQDTPPELYMLNTPGCKIPLHMVNYRNNIQRGKIKTNCGKRMVFLKKIGRDKVQAKIVMKNKGAVNYCCYRFISGSENEPTSKIKYTACIKFHDKTVITLKTDFINVICFEYKKNISHIIYDDIYGFIKGINMTKNSTETNGSLKYNVLMIGMDTMSLPRFLKTLTRVSRFFQENFWLGYRGYHKVADNTFPNLMAALTGKNLSTLIKLCADKMDQCQKYIIWDTFKKAGYVTAYGEDNIGLPDIFSNKYSFKSPPTDHYMRPLFLKGETKLKSLVCAGKIPSGQQLLHYALDFADTYKNDNFFGLFWMNSFSHDEHSRPQDVDAIIENFLNQLTYTGVLKDTFIIFFSDHGLRFGEYRMKVESYYDERLPMLFMWPPLKFKGIHYDELNALIKNQKKLITPYDLYHTLVYIHDISLGTRTEVVLDSCPKCHSIFELVSENRTCQDVGIHDKWCSCHKLYPLPVKDVEGEKSVKLAVSHIQSIVKSIRTKPCWSCASNLSLGNITRMHFYYHVDKISLIYLVAFTMKPINISYEASVLLKNGERKLIGPVSVISLYRNLGYCTINSRDRWFCSCQRNEKCWSLK